MVTGEHLVDARAAFDGGMPVVSFKFDSSGGKKFGEATQNHVGERLAIVLDNEVISAPNIQTAILGGSGQISGNFTLESAQELALLLRSGALPAPLEVLEERTVGAGLGSDSISEGITASVIGLIAVVLFMIAAYGLFGIFTTVTVFLNLFLMLGILSVIGATLTLPGIAGIILTIGMAVDANVLIFERMREEVKTGVRPRRRGSRIYGSLGHDRRLQPDDARRRVRSALLRHRTGQRLRRHAGNRYCDLHVYFGYRHPSDHHRMAAKIQADQTADLTEKIKDNKEMRILAG